MIGDEREKNVRSSNMNNSSLEFSPFNWLSLVSGLNRRFALKYITVEDTKFLKELYIMIQVL